MLGMISFGSGLGALFMLLDAASDHREAHSLSPGSELGLGMFLLVIAIICAVLAKLLGEED